MAVGESVVVAVIGSFCAFRKIKVVVPLDTVNCVNIYFDLVVRQSELPLRTRHIVNVRNYAEAIINVGQLTKWKIPVVVAAEAGACRACTVVVVWPVRAVSRNAQLESVIAARLARIYFVVSAAVCSCVEVAAGAGLNIIAARLRVPEQRLSQLNPPGF